MCGTAVLKHVTLRHLMAVAFWRRDNGDGYDASRARRICARPTRAAFGDSRRLRPDVHAGRKGVVPAAISLARVHLSNLVHHPSRVTTHDRRLDTADRTDRLHAQHLADRLWRR